MDVRVTRRVLKGLGANAYGQVITVVVQLVGVPILLHAWGTQLYGEWLILFAIPAYLAMGDLGFSQSAGNDMTARVGRDDQTGALSVFQTLAVLIYSIAILGLVFTATLLPFLPIRAWLHLEAMDESAARWVLWLLAAQIFVALPNGVSHAGFRASGDYPFHVSMDGTTRLVQFSGIWIAALAGGGPIAAAATFFGVRVLATFALAMSLSRRHPWLVLGFARARQHELHRLFNPALANIALPLAQALNIQGMVLVVGALLGPLAVVAFSTLRTLTRLALQVVLAVNHAAEPELAAAYGAGNRALMQSLFLHAQRAGFWLAFAAAFGLAIYGRFILDVWTHGKVVMNSALFALLLVSAVASVLWYGALIALKAANQHLHATLVFVFASAAALTVAALLLGWTHQLAAAGLALLLMDVSLALYTFRSAARLLQLKVVATLCYTANPFPLMAFALRKAYFR